jgi:Tfp pilus assembly protein PilX
MFTQRIEKVERLKEERGAALVIALLVMVICALLGASSILTSNTDMQIAANEKTYHQALMNADAGIQWLRTQNLQTMSGFSSGQLATVNATIAAASTVIRFTIPQNPVFVWSDPTAGGAPVFRVQSRGTDQNSRGSVLLEAEIRLAPPAGPVEDLQPSTEH